MHNKYFQNDKQEVFLLFRGTLLSLRAFSYWLPIQRSKISQGLKQQQVEYTTNDNDSHVFLNLHCPLSFIKYSHIHYIA